MTPSRRNDSDRPDPRSRRPAPPREIDDVPEDRDDSQDGTSVDDDTDLDDAVTDGEHGDGDDGAPRLAREDWARLAEMRRAFLVAGERGGGEDLPDYWRDGRDLELYDVTFGARIGWKWDAVLDEMQRAGVVVPRGTVVDWGAGTGVAARRFLARHGRAGARVHWHERSTKARSFASQRLRTEIAGVEVDAELPREPAVLLVSHVLSEIGDAALAELVALARRAELVVWVESGSKAVSRALSTARDALLDALDPLLPCTHRAACGVLASGREGDWCHHFAEPAPEAFTTAHWRAFSRELGIDLRALPYAYLVLRRRATTPLPLAGAVRILGTPRPEKGRVTFDVCDASGVTTCSLLQRTDKAYFKDLERGRAPRVLDVEREGTRITSFRVRLPARGAAPE